MTKASDQEKGTPPGFVLEIQEGPLEGKSIAPKKGAVTLRVGRTKASKLQIKDPAVSERHAEISFRDGAWCLKDLGSSNGTKVNDVEVSDEWVTLKHGDVIRFGTESVAKMHIESEKEIDEDITVQQFLESEYELLEKRIRSHAETISQNLRDAFARSKAELLSAL